jgi:hypothetical protein
MAIVNVNGEITFLLVHNRGGGFGPANDKIDVEVVFKLASKPDQAYGFQLRDDAQRPAREGMLALLRDAFENGWTVGADVDLPADRKNGVASRVWITRRHCAVSRAPSGCR